MEIKEESGSSVRCALVAAFVVGRMACFSRLELNVCENISDFWHKSENFQGIPQAKTNGHPIVCCLWDSSSFSLAKKRLQPL